MKSHSYKPPEEFLQALHDGPAPPDEEYFARLKELGLQWNRTSAPPQKPPRIRLAPEAPKGRQES